MTDLCPDSGSGFVDDKYFTIGMTLKSVTASTPYMTLGYYSEGQVGTRERRVTRESILTPDSKRGYFAIGLTIWIMPGS